MCRRMNNKVAANKAASPETTRWCESKSSPDEEPSGSLNSHFADQDEEEAECSGVIGMATRLSFNFNLPSPENGGGGGGLFCPSHPSEILIFSRANRVRFVLLWQSGRERLLNISHSSHTFLNKHHHVAVNKQLLFSTYNFKIGHL